MSQVPKVRLFSVSLLVVLAGEVFAQSNVSLELVRGSGLAVGGERKWISVLQPLDLAGIRIRSVRAGDQPKVENIGTERSPSYRVVGVLTNSNKLVLPGARAFSLSDRGEIQRWFQALNDQGEDVTKVKGAFGLTAEQLVATHERLEIAVPISTKEKPPREVLRTIAGGLEIKIQVDSASRPMLDNDDQVRDELKGLSSGTAMAAILRPMGLVLVPVRAGPEIQLLVIDSRKASESWPVGWPPQQPPNKTMPELFKFLNVEIEDISLDEAMSAIGGRLEAPILYDHNSMARQQIDLEQIPVKFPAGRTFYKAILDRLLAQGQLKTEIRVDENGKAFHWVSTIKSP